MLLLVKSSHQPDRYYKWRHNRQGRPELSRSEWLAISLIDKIDPG
jgi:hypothetical protein